MSKLRLDRLLPFIISGMILLGCNHEKNEQKTQPLDTLRFFTFGDWGRNGAGLQKDLANAMDQLASNRPLDFVLALGDNFYPEGVTSVTDPQWKTSFEDIYVGALAKAPWYVALGNHDYYGNPRAEIDYTSTSSRWKMPSYFYTVKFTMKDKGTVRLVVLDTNPFEKSYYSLALFDKKFVIDTTRQKVWMDSVFALKDADWTIVAGHHPIYTGGMRVNEVNSIRSSLVPIFTKYQLPAYFAGHEHDLQHLKAPDKPTNQFVSGAGSEIRSTGSMAFTQFSASVQGFMSVEVTRKTMNVFVISYQRDTLYHTILVKYL